MTTRRFEPFGFLRDLASRWDLVAFVVVIGLIAFLGEAARGLFIPLSQLDVVPISLDPVHLPEYAARTTLRMLAALVVSSERVVAELAAGAIDPYEAAARLLGGLLPEA